MVTTTTGLATSFIQFTRTSNATVTDSNGFIKWAGHNLLTNSESFDASAWVKSSATVTANTDPAPNGTTTGDTIAASGANGTALQTWTAEAVPYTFGVWLRRKTGTGNIQIAADSGTYTTVTITSSWALYTVTQTPAAGSKSAGIRIVSSGDEVYAWGAHLYRSDLGGMVLNPARGDAYYPTTPRNLLGFTEDFSNALWGKTDLLAFGSGSISNAIIAPNGLQTADKIVESTANGLHTIDQYYTTTASPYTFSIYLKKAERSFALVYHGQSNTGIVVNLDTGATTLSAGISAPVASSATSVGDGWYRCSITVNATAASNFFRIYLMPSASVISYTGDGTSGIYLWGAQLSDSASLDAYSPVYGAAVTSAAYYAPRLDYDPVTLAAKGLLVEEQRANLQTYSEDFRDTSAAGSTRPWVYAGGTITSDATSAPSGLLTADKLVEDSLLNEHGVFATNTVVASSVYTFGVFAKAGERTKLRLIYANNGGTTGGIFASFDLSAGTAGSATAYGVGSSASSAIRSVGSGWYYCSLSGAIGTNTGSIVRIRLEDASGNETYTGNGTSGAFIWGAQLEAGSFATSYIPTGAATATRTADVASVSTQAFPYSASVGSIVVGWRAGQNSSTTARVIWMDDTDTGVYDNFVTIRQGGNVSTAGAEGAALVNAGTATTVIATSPAITVGSTYKAGFAFAANDFALSVNGQAPVTNGSGAVPSGIDLMRIGGHRDGTYINGHIRQITYIPRRLTNSELQARTV